MTFNNKTFFQGSVSLISIFLLTFNVANAGGGHIRDTAECLEISGIVYIDGDSANHISVELILDNEQVEILDVFSYQPFKFYLKRDKHYTIKLTKDMFIRKSISVSTDIPHGTKIKSPYKFHFETDLVKAPDIKSQHADAMDFPIALIRFSDEKKKFEYSQKYNDMINKEIDKDLYKIYGGDGDSPEPEKPKKDKKKK